MAIPLDLRPHEGPASGRVVHLRHDMPRYMRVRQQIGGLIDLYSCAGIDGGRGAEVGCYWGESAEIAAQFLGELCCVDPWPVSYNEGIFDERMRRFKEVCKFKAKSHLAAPWIADESLDIVYIDAKHDYDNVKRDLLAWLPKIVDDGWIAGHDYDTIPEHAGVPRAVDEILGPPALVFPDKSFLVRKTSSLIERIRSMDHE